MLVSTHDLDPRPAPVWLEFGGRILTMLTPNIRYLRYFVKIFMLTFCPLTRVYRDSHSPDRIPNADDVITLREYIRILVSVKNIIYI